MDESKSFLGRGLKFPLGVDPRTGKIAMVSFEEDIREAVGIIIRTWQGERVMRPGFGCDAMNYTFGSASESAVSRISGELKRSLTLQEPRIQDVSVVCGEDQPGTLTVNIGYTVRSTNNRYNLVYPFYLMEGSIGL